MTCRNCNTDFLTSEKRHLQDNSAGRGHTTLAPPAWCKERIGIRRKFWVVTSYMPTKVMGLRIQLMLKGCANRPFYHIVASSSRRRPLEEPIEQIGSFDPMPNETNQKLVAINFDRLRYWMGQGAKPSEGVGCLLGLAGYTQVHPRTFMSAWRNRGIIAEETAAKAAEGDTKTSDE
ncbi:small ribosomal subunit protein bS16m-like [Ornithodoros turicata]